MTVKNVCYKQYCHKSLLNLKSEMKILENKENTSQSTVEERLRQSGRKRACYHSPKAGGISNRDCLCIICY